MRIDKALWLKAKKMYMDYQDNGKPLSRLTLMKALGVSENTARILKAVLENEHIFKDDFPQEVKDTDPLHLYDKEYTIDFGGERKIRFAAIADTHIGSKAFKHKELVEFYKRADKFGAEFVLHAGDIIDGIGVYKGQEFEVVTPSIDEQLDILVEYYPNLKRGTTKFILGNHDYIAWKRMGIDVGKQIKRARKDLEYLGMVKANILIDGIRVQLWHGRGRGAYTLSYKPQKAIEQFVPGRKPRILLIGHWHQTFWMPAYRNVDAFQVGCFQGETLLTKEMGVQPIVGGWLIEITHKKGEVKVTSGRFVYFYETGNWLQ